jgi:hypothetical protein
MIPDGIAGDARYHVHHDATELQSGVAFQLGNLSRWGIMVVRGSVRRRERGMIRKINFDGKY